MSSSTGRPIPAPFTGRGFLARCSITNSVVAASRISSRAGISSWSRPWPSGLGGALPYRTSAAIQRTVTGRESSTSNPEAGGVGVSIVRRRAGAATAAAALAVIVAKLGGQRRGRRIVLPRWSPGRWSWVAGRAVHRAGRRRVLRRKWCVQEQRRHGFGDRRGASHGDPRDGGNSPVSSPIGCAGRSCAGASRKCAKYSRRRAENPRCGCLPLWWLGGSLDRPRGWAVTSDSLARLASRGVSGGGPARPHQKSVAGAGGRSIPKGSRRKGLVDEAFPRFFFCCHQSCARLVWTGRRGESLPTSFSQPVMAGTAHGCNGSAKFRYEFLSPTCSPDRHGRP